MTDQAPERVRDYLTSVPGRAGVPLILFALSTCVWCRRTRQLLDSLGVAYHYVYMDRLTGEAARRAEADLTHWNPRSSFPTLVVDERTVIVGYAESKIREALGV